MRSSQKVWRMMGLLAFSATLVLVGGFIYAVDTVLRPDQAQVMKPAEEKKAPPALDEIRILALGDSLTKGAGDDEGEGYAGRVKNKLDDALDIPVSIANFAVNGYETNQLLADLTNSKGIITAVETYNVILLTIGGNNLFSLGEEVTLDKANEQIDQALADVKHIFARLAELNPNSTIIYSGLYNPFSYMELDENISLYVQERWNLEVFKIAQAHPQIIVVPTYDLFQQDPKAYLSSDLYHPNAKGYDRIADRIIQVLDYELSEVNTDE